jgi:hypothetical protein
MSSTVGLVSSARDREHLLLAARDKGRLVGHLEDGRSKRNGQTVTSPW